VLLLHRLSSSLQQQIGQSLENLLACPPRELRPNSGTIASVFVVEQTQLNPHAEVLLP
jgi:hypothetical protein